VLPALIKQDKQKYTGTTNKILSLSRIKNNSYGMIKM
jgi:hypothetical protein